MALVDVTKRFSEEEETQNRALAAALMLWSKEAEAGRFSMIGIVGVCRDRSIDYKLSPGKDNNLMIAAAAILQHEAIVAAETQDLPFKDTP